MHHALPPTEECIIFSSMNTALICIALFMSSIAFAAPGSPTPSPAAKASGAPVSDLDRSFDEFKAAAERLGKAMGKAADSNTVEVREKVMKTMSGVMVQLSHTLNDTAKKIEPTPKAASPTPSPQH
jgi:ElaB/YqjD/DUF883 family membrane-anchored ribosome-binding protein